MQLTRHTDYALRSLLFLAARPDQLCSIGEIADNYAISRNHLMKVVNELVHAGFVQSVRGRNGGIRLARPAADISIGAVVRKTENAETLVNCADCRIRPRCGLPGIFRRGIAAFYAELDGVTLADVGGSPQALGALLGIAD